MGYFSFFKKAALNVMEKFNIGKNIKQWPSIDLFIHSCNIY